MVPGLKRWSSSLLVVAVMAAGVADIPGTDASPVAVRRSPASLPALRSAPVRERRPAMPVGDSSATVHGTRRLRAVTAPRGYRVADANDPPDVTYPTAPADGAVVTTSTPTLAVEESYDDEGDAIRYRFKVTTRSDAESGTVVVDAAIPGTALTVPDGALKDGVTYFWHVYTTDAAHPSGTAPGWVQSFRVDYRLGVRPTFPYDSVGPVQVNLSSGNVVLSAGSATADSLAGPAGVSFTYNGQAPATPGLIGTYTNDANGNHAVDAGETSTVVRRDAELAFDWGTGAPAPGLTATDTVVRWVGTVTSPVPGAQSFRFGATTSDGVRIRVNGTLVLDAWSDHAAAAPIYDQAVSLTGGVPVSISVDWYKGTAPGSVLKLYVRGAGGTSFDESLVPASWLAADPGALPRGWTMTPIGGSSGLSYVRAEVADGKVTLVGPDGSTHVFTSTGSGYTPPPGDDGVLARDANGLLTLADTDGLTYVFDAAGVLRSATSSSDLKAAHTYTWSTPGGSDLPRLTAITDPVAQRSVTLQYGGGSCPTGSEADPTHVPAGFDAAAPGGMLCAVTTWDGRTTRLWYVAGRLGRLEDPGGSITDFAYDGDGRLWKVRDPLAADLVGALLRTDDDTTRTVLGYDASGRVTSVTQAAPTAGAARPGHTYEYASSTEVRVHVAGLVEPNLWARKVTLDATGRLLTDTDATNRSSSLEWDGADRLVASTDPAGLRSTSIFDGAGRVTDAYGPAPAAWFGADRRPLPAYAAQVPHSTTAYDEGWKGLDVVFFDNPTFSGVPVGHTLGIGDPSGAMDGVWTVGLPPVPGITATSWSARMTGEVTFPEAGSYVLAPNASGTVRLYVDDTKLVDSASGLSNPYVNAVAGSTHRIRVDLVAPAAGSGTAHRTFAYTGSDESWVVPAGVTSVTVEAWGAQGGAGAALNPSYETRSSGGAGGLGGYVRSTFAVTPGETLTARVGGQGAAGYWWLTAAGGSVGGGAGGTAILSGPGGGGGGKTTFSRGSTVLTIAGGGGGGGGASFSPGFGGATTYHPGGAGGASQAAGSSSGVIGAGGGSAGVGGTGGAASEYGGAGTSTSGGTGADGAGDSSSSTGGGGGGGAGHGGGAGGGRGSGGGGGGNLTSGSGVTITNAVQSGNGRVDVSWTSPAALDLEWSRPSGVAERIPGTAFAPRYGYATSAVDADGRKVATEYGNPALGLPTASITDPAGLGLRSTTTYEGVGSGYLRPLTRRLPKGASTQVAYAYYGATETRANPCIGGSTGVGQGGRLKLSTDADPDGAGPQQAIQREQVYDAAGRVVATRVVGDSGWACTTYDARGRVRTSTDRSGATTTMSYATPGTVSAVAPDSSGTSRSTVTVVDLLGRTVRYTDELGTETRYAYDQTGAVTATYRTFSGGSEVPVTSATYDPAGRTLTASDHVGGPARTTTYTYDAAGRLATEVRPNGVTTAHAYSSTSGLQTQVASYPTAAGGPTTTETFASTGSPVSTTLPAHVQEVTVDAWGAQGGGVYGGKGGHAHGTVTVTSGETLYIRVGGRGQSGAGGYNGGGAGAYGGGGASDVRRSGQALGDRLVVGGGGGGISSFTSTYDGGGGGATGGDGGVDSGGHLGGGGGTQSAGGVGATGSGGGASGGAGTSGVGGASGDGTAGGGGGWFGGGGGARTSWYDEGAHVEGTGGGGGSSHATGPDADVSDANVRTGDGQVTLTYPSSAIPTWNYTYSLGGRIVGKWALRTSPTAYAYDGAGRLTATVEGATTRRYAYDADTNRCGLAATCESGWVYDDADRITASPYASSYTYDSHGNLTATTGTGGNPSAAIAYDADDHATVIDDGTSTVTETLAPSGRVLRRVVTTNATAAVVEDVSYGYSSSGDSPAYSRPTAGGAVTTYLVGLGGLTDVGGTGTWSLYDAHGDVQGTTSSTGSFTATPTADEFGVGAAPASRLGWLGEQQRPSVGGALGLVRMGVRLYDPRLGRFLEVDPVEGGSANDYDYVNGDPVNDDDLDGRLADACAGSKNRGKCLADRDANAKKSKGTIGRAVKKVVKTVTAPVRASVDLVRCAAYTDGNHCGGGVRPDPSGKVVKASSRAINHCVAGAGLRPTATSAGLGAAWGAKGGPLAAADGAAGGAAAAQAQHCLDY